MSQQEYDTFLKGDSIEGKWSAPARGLDHVVFFFPYMLCKGKTDIEKIDDICKRSRFGLHDDDEIHKYICIFETYDVDVYSTRDTYWNRNNILEERYVHMYNNKNMKLLHTYVRGYYDMLEEI